MTTYRGEDMIGDNVPSRKIRLSSPMTAEQATEKHQCRQCAEGGFCGWDCVLSATCSLVCAYCGIRNYFTGDLPAVSARFDCVACGKENLFIRRRS